MQTVHVIQDFPQPVERVFAYLGEHENLESVFGAKIRRLNDGTDGSRNGAGSAREMRVGPLPPFVETTIEVIPNELIRYRITKGGVLKDHEGVLRFTSRGDGSHLDWTISFNGKVPGIAPIIRAKLTRDVSRAMQRLAATQGALGNADGDA
ncbi:MAG TPA: SRPBCC family protein [Solirubrobacteraceae bacterium]|jgi:uncharacterized protein YndB with AHSA1/START domain